MEKLYILDYFEKRQNKPEKEFFENSISKGKLVKNQQMDILEDKGISLIEQTIQYIENIYRNPNRLIVNEEEIVKIELAKKITVDSIKHLSRHTNFIQNVDENGDVELSNILNINKEEDYNTYENRLIYTLIQNIKLYIKDKKEFLEKLETTNKKIYDKKLEYISNSTVDGKEISINCNLNSEYTEDGIKNKIKKELKKIKMIEDKINTITQLDIYIMLNKKNIRLIKSPIKKTNLILKNVNFQYVMKLWYFLEENLFNKEKQQEVIIDIEKDEKLKRIVEEIFLLQYIFLERQEDDEEINEKKQQLVKNVLDYTELSNKEIERILFEKSKNDKSKNRYVEKQIRKIFEQYFEEYEKKLIEYKKIK